MSPNTLILTDILVTLFPFVCLGRTKAQYWVTGAILTCCFAELARDTQSQEMLWMKCHYSKNPAFLLLKLCGILPWKSVEAGLVPRSAAPSIVISRGCRCCSCRLQDVKHEMLITSPMLAHRCFLILLWAVEVYRSIKFEDRKGKGQTSSVRFIEIRKKSVRLLSRVAEGAELFSLGKRRLGRQCCFERRL